VNGCLLCESDTTGALCAPCQLVAVPSPAVHNGKEVNDPMMPGAMIAVLDSKTAARLVVAQHYLHRRPPISHAFGLYVHGKLLGAVTYGTPASRHLQKSACPSDPGKVLELNRLWLDDQLGPNSESWFVSRTLKMLPPRIVVSYADPLFGHYGYIYRALNFRYAGWTDMERKTPRYDYIPLDPSKHTRDAFRDGPGLSGVAYRRRRVAKVKYWIPTGNHAERRTLTRLCGWPSLSWKTLPPPVPQTAAEEVTA
jgi:hypothetical protein